MGAATDQALELVREITAEHLERSTPNDDDRRAATWEMFGVERLAMRLDHDAAVRASPLFKSAVRQIWRAGLREVEV